MDRLTRKGLKTDRFAVEVGHTVDFLTEHRTQVTRYGIAAGVVLLVVIGIFLYNRHQARARRDALEAAMRIQAAQIGASGAENAPSFPTRAQRDQAATKAFTELASRHSGSQQAGVARYYLATIAADQGRLADAEKLLREVIASRQEPAASLAVLALAEALAGQGKLPEAEKMLRAVMEKPTLFLSREQAAIELAGLLAPTQPDQARKLLEPLRTSPRGAVSRTALSHLATLPAR